MDSIIPPQDDIPLKRCTSCPEDDCWYPATTEFFHRSKTGKYGLVAYCKSCASAYRQGSLKRQSRTKEQLPEGYLRCTDTCKNVYPATTDYFYQNKKGTDGWDSRCKECISEKQKELRNNPETCDQVRSRNKEQGKAYRTSPRGKEVMRVHTHNYRTRKREVQGTHTLEQIQEQLKRQKHRCYYAACGFAKFKKKEDGSYEYHIEHTFPVKRIAGTDIPGNDISYIVLACEHCNESKKSRYPWEWPEGGRLL